MLTATVIFFSLFPLLFFGLPLSRILFPDEPLSKSWVKVPFLGLAFVVLLTQNLVYADIPVKLSTPWVWGLGVLLWVGWLFWEYRRGARPTSIKFSTSTFITAFFLLVVYVVQGFGLLGTPARYYVARAWHDQFNYVALAQFIMDYPFSTPVAELLDQPYAVKVLQIPNQPEMKALIHDRIGQSIYQAFVASSSNADAKTTFEVTILLLPVLASIAVYWIARENFSPWVASLALLGAGVLPALAMLHLESFLSQSLGIPILLVFPLFVHEIMERFSVRALFAAALVLSAGISIYTEFTPLYFIEIFVPFIFWVASQISLRWEVFSQRDYSLRVTFSEMLSWDGSIGVLINHGKLIFIALLLNIGFLNGSASILTRVAQPGLLLGIYPWALQMEGINRLWFGDWSAASPVPALFLSLLGVSLTVAAYFGLFLNWRTKKTLPNFAFLTIALLPLAALLLGSEYAYQFYKLQLSVSPLYVIGVLYWVDNVKPIPLDLRIVKLENRALLMVLPVFLLSGAATLAMTYRSGFGGTMEEIGRGGGHLLQSQDMKNLSNLMNTVSDTDVLVAYRDDFYDGNYINGWISYLSRNNRVYLVNPLISDISVPDVTVRNIELSGLPGGSVLITSTQLPCEGKVFGSQINPLLENNMVRVGQISDNNWAFIDQINIPNGLERDPAGTPFFWIGNDPASMVVYAGNSMLLKFHLTLQPGPSLPLGIPRTLKIGSHEIFQTVNLQGPVADLTVEVPVSSGRNEITFQVVENPTVFLENDSRTLLIMFSSYCRIELVEK